MIKLIIILIVFVLAYFIYRLIGRIIGPNEAHKRHQEKIESLRLNDTDIAAYIIKRETWSRNHWKCARCGGTENLDYNLWLNMLSSVLAAHFQSLTGIFTNFFKNSYLS